MNQRNAVVVFHEMLKFFDPDNYVGDVELAARSALSRATGAINFAQDLQELVNPDRSDDRAGDLDPSHVEVVTVPRGQASEQDD